MQDGGVPDHDHQRPVFLGIPAPEPAPRLISPDAAQHRADEAKQSGEADDAVNHFSDASAIHFVERHLVGYEVPHHIHNRQEPGDERGRVADGDDHHMRRKPEVGVEHGLQHLHGVATQRKAVCDKQGHEPNRAGHDVTDTVPVDAFKDQAKNHCTPTDEHRRRVQVRHRRPAL